jgi:hypothetical protein
MNRNRVSKDTAFRADQNGNKREETHLVDAACVF